MQPDATPPHPAEPAKGLPPVVPLSGKYLVQLFLVPGLIVAVAVVILLGFSWLAGSSRTPQQFLAHLQSNNDDVRWRAANDLAQVLKRDDQLASDPKFGLQLADLLRRALQDTDRKERDGAERSDSTPDQKKALENSRKYVIFLSACLGNGITPVGAPLLSEIAVRSQGTDPSIVARQRMRAIWALANLGDNLKRFDRLAPERRQAVLAELEAESQTVGETGTWARAALVCLQGRQSGQPQAIGVDQALAKCADDPNPFLRLVSAQALTFWEGSPTENAQMEQALLRLTRDTGLGEQLLAPLLDEDKDQRETEGTGSSKQSGLGIRYQAAAGLAMRGSPLVNDAVLDLLGDMLDEETLRQNFRIKPKTGPEVPDEATVRTTLDYGLKAVAELHRRRPTLDLSKLSPALDTLAQSPNVAVRTAAERTRLALNPQ